EPFASTYRKWVNNLVSTLREKFGFDAAHVMVLTDQPAAGEQLANAENVKATFSKLAGQVKDGDLLFVLLMGHGGGDGAEAKFNLVGPDLTVIEWSASLSPIKARIAFVDSTGGSFPYLKGLSAPGRVVITATATSAQRYDTVFPEFFIQALTASVADSD